jgi:hypothetical protein
MKSVVPRSNSLTRFSSEETRTEENKRNAPGNSWAIYLGPSSPPLQERQIPALPDSGTMGAPAVGVTLSTLQYLLPCREAILPPVGL